MPENGELSPSSTRDLLTYSYDYSGLPLTAELVSGPAHAASFTLHADGTFDFVAATGYTGSDSFTFEVTDGTQTSLAATVSLTISAVPVGNPDLYVLPASGTLTVSAGKGVLANDFRPHGQFPVRRVVFSAVGGHAGLECERQFHLHATDHSAHNGCDLRVSTGRQSHVRSRIRDDYGTLAPPQVPTVSVTSVTFNNAKSILKDITGVAFPRGWSSAEPNDSNPLAIVAKQQVNVSAVFTITSGTLPQFIFPTGTLPQLWAPISVVATAGDVTIKGTAIAVGNQLIFTGVCTSPEFISAAVEKGLSFTWTITLPNAVTINGGVSKNDIYVLRKAPLPTVPLFHTLVDLSTRAAASKPGGDDLVIATAIAAQFQTRSITRLDGDPKTLTYWGDWADLTKRATTGGGDSLQKLLATGDGTCVAWGQFGAAALLLQGVDLPDQPLVELKAKPINPPKSDFPEAYLVTPEWKIPRFFSKPENKNFDIDNVFRTATGYVDYEKQKYQFYEPSAYVTYIPGNFVGQGGNEQTYAPAIFVNHFVVNCTLTTGAKTQTFYFDPSYGTFYGSATKKLPGNDNSTSLTAYQNLILSSFQFVAAIDQPGNASFSYLGLKKVTLDNLNTAIIAKPQAYP